MQTFGAAEEDGPGMRGWRHPQPSGCYLALLRLRGRPRLRIRRRWCGYPLFKSWTSY